MWVLWSPKILKTKHKFSISIFQAKVEGKKEPCHCKPIFLILVLLYAWDFPFDFNGSACWITFLPWNSSLFSWRYFNLNSKKQGKGAWTLSSAIAVVPRSLMVYKAMIKDLQLPCRTILSFSNFQLKIRADAWQSAVISLWLTALYSSTSLGIGSLG